MYRHVAYCVGFCLFVFSTISLSAQSDTLVLRLGTGTGEDALIRDDYPFTPLGNEPDITSNAWTVGGNPCILRSLFRFDLTVLPPYATVFDARLSLYCNTTSGYYQLQSGENESYLLRVTQYWDQQSVTWTTQPATSMADPVIIPASTSNTQSYPDIDVTLQVQDMVSNPAGNFGWMIQLVTEELYRSMVFASGDHPQEDWRPLLTIIYETCPIPIAGFTHEKNDRTVTFTDLSVNATSWHWDFGDGDTSDLQNPVHEYASYQDYVVTLTAVDSCGESTFTDTISVCQPPATYYTFGINDHFVSFEDSSFEATAWFWDFDDGFYSDLEDPLHYFNDYGTYYVCLTSTNSCMSQTWCDSVILLNVGASEDPVSTYRIWPNPTDDAVTIVPGEGFSGRSVSILISNMAGQQVLEKKINVADARQYYRIELSSFPPGIYNTTILSDERTATKRLVIL